MYLNGGSKIIIPDISDEKFDQFCHWDSLPLKENHQFWTFPSTVNGYSISVKHGSVIALEITRI
jgi:hypothetical protein